MSTTKKKQSRQQLFDRLWHLGRKISTQTVFLHQAIAQSVGLNATDTKCIDVILQGPEGKVTAGWLAEVTGLTTGAVTHILDRLEKRGYIERIRDTADRRKVFLQPRIETLKPLAPKYEAMGKAFSEVVRRYGDRDLRIICEYMEQTSAVSERELAAMKTTNQARTSARLRSRR